MADIVDSIIRTYDHVWGRFVGRLDGLSDEEYLWEPVAGCWSLRKASDGHWRLDGNGGGGPAPHPVPVTTIAWRVGHLGPLALGGFTDRCFGTGAFRRENLELAPNAEAVVALLDAQFRAWRDGLADLTPSEWRAPLGSSWGPYAEANMVDLALHVLDEVVHHAAEVGVLRDLYEHRSSLRR